jgi:high-affinity iron transporter
MLYFRSIFFIIFLFSQLALAKANNARQIINLVSYISKDYQKALNNQRVVINQDEMNEMEQFIQDAIDLFDSATNKNNNNISKQLLTLKQLILQKELPQLVSQKAHVISQDLIKYFNIPTHPKHQIDIKSGRSLFNNSCSPCHGIDGQGIPLLNKTMNPPPTDLRATDGEKTQTPFSINNTLRTGIPNTAMLSFSSSLAEEDLWNISFYVMSLPHKNKNSGTNSLEQLDLSIKDLANLTDYDLEKILKQNKLNPKEINTIRTNHSFIKNLPLETKYKAKTPLKGIELSQRKISYLQENINSLDKMTIKTLLIDAYLEGFEYAENRLKLKNKKLTETIEKSFIKIRSFSPQSKEFNKELAHIDKQLKKAHLILTTSQQQKDTPWEDFIASLTIILREGFEAFLIIAALLALIKSSGNLRAQRFIHGAWISALFAGALSYLIFFYILSISGSTRELIEAISTAIAVGLLFYTGYWLLSQSERIAWGGFIKSKTKNAIIEQKLWTIFWLGFVAVYRETAETILFYQALLSTATNKLMILNGFVTGIVALIITCFSIQKFQLKISLNKFFKTTGIMMFIISVVLSGKATYEAIEAGYINHTYIDWLPTFTFLGIYPIKETVSIQLLLLIIAASIYLIQTRQPSVREAKNH